MWLVAVIFIAAAALFLPSLFWPAPLVFSRLSLILVLHVRDTCKHRRRGDDAPPRQTRAASAAKE